MTGSLILGAALGFLGMELLILTAAILTEPILNSFYNWRHRNDPVFTPEIFSAEMMRLLHRNK